MADEIQVSASLDVEKDNLKLNKKVTRQQTDMAGDAYSANVQDIGTTNEQVTLAAAVATAGWAWFRNLDSTNYVEIGVLGAEGTPQFHALLKLTAGQVAVVPLATTTFYAKADTAAVALEVIVVEA